MAYQQRWIKTLADLNRRMRGPVPAWMVSAWVDVPGRGISYSDRRARQVLQALACEGKVKRVGYNRGWVAV